MKVKNLKLFGLTKEYSSLFSILSTKISEFSKVSIDNTPSNYRGFIPLVYWEQHFAILSNLNICMREIRADQDLYIMGTDNFIVTYDDDSRFIDSLQLLNSCLSHLTAGWMSIPYMLGELKLNSQYFWGDLENQLIFFWIDAISAINEILKILYSWRKELFMRGFFINKLDRDFYTVSYVTPIFVESTRFKKFIYGSRDFWTEAVVKWFFIYDKPVAALDAGFRQKLNFKYRIQNLARKEAVEFVLREILLDLDIKMLRFLAGNGLINLNVFRKLGPLHPLVSK